VLYSNIYENTVLHKTYFTFAWPCIVTNFFIIKPTRCTNFTNLFWLYVWHTLLLSVQWINSWWWTEELSEACRVSCQNKFVKLVHLVGFIIKKLHRTCCVRLCFNKHSESCNRPVYWKHFICTSRRFITV